MGEITRGILLVKIVQISGVFQINIDERIETISLLLFVEFITVLAVEIMIHLFRVFDVRIYRQLLY